MQYLYTITLTKTFIKIDISHFIQYVENYKHIGMSISYRMIYKVTAFIDDYLV